MTTISLHFIVKLFIIFCIFMSIITLIVFKKTIDKIIEYKIKKLEVEEYKIRLGVTLDQDLDKVLDQIITSCFNEYSLINLVIKPDWYIKEDEEIKINKEVAHLVTQRLSPIILEKLYIVYNKDALYDIIAKKIHFIVAEFVIKHNRTSGI